MEEKRQVPFIIPLGFFILVVGFYIVFTSEQPAEAYKDYVKVKMSWYNPALLGVNCAVVRNNKCVSHMANGERWQDWIDKGVCACPKEYAFGTVFSFPSLGMSCTCKDRGGKIVANNGVVWIDLLTHKPPVPFGTVIDAEVIQP
jgi:hypothetical protein